MLLFHTKTKIRRFINKFFQFNRPSTYPYITGDGFRNIANFIFDQFSEFNPQDVSAGDVVFVRSDFIPHFFDVIHPKINKPYVLISHNDDTSIHPELAEKIDSKIIHWYAENLCFKHPKATLLPIGLQNFSVGNEENFTEQISVGIPTDFDQKKTRILFAFGLHNAHPERKDADMASLKTKLADKVELPRKEYYKKLSEYKFIASPRGGGLDCHRTWEALHFKAIPILLKSIFSELLKESGYPVLLIDTWDEVASLTPEFLDNFYAENERLFNTPKLYLPYWYNAITNHRKK